MARDTRTHYQMLGISPDATPDDVWRAHRKHQAALQDDATAPDLRAAMLAQTAYEVLSDPARRAAYDEQLRASGKVARRALERRRLRIGGAVAAVAVAGAAAWLVFQPAATSTPHEAGDILADASLAIGRVQLVEISGRTTDIGLAFALDKGAFATSCAAVTPGSHLLVHFAQRQVSAHVAREATPVCRLTADGLGSWPLRLRESLPARGEKVYGVRLDATNQAHLVEGGVHAVLAGDDGVPMIEVRGAAAAQPAGGPLVDAQGRVLGIALGAGRYLPVPGAWMTEMRAQSDDLPAPPPPPSQRMAEPNRAPGKGPAKEIPPDFIEKYNHDRAEALRKSLTVPDDL